ncbi:hypothetical protein [Streptomyces sp. NPDC048665]|uniref:DUF6924 domain-containing protein n=1 Tax=Streptomyces sp. NPDC048665 TaxID=3155490 RepID=UPI00341EA4F7
MWDADIETMHAEAAYRGRVSRPRGRQPATADEIAAAEHAATCRRCHAPVITLPPTNGVPIVRTGFRHESVWQPVVTAALKITPEGIHAGVDPVDEPACRDLTVDQLLDRLQDDRRHRILFVVDATAIADSEHAILAVDLYDGPGRSVRVLPSTVQDVVDNVTIADMACAEFADAADACAVFRGF